ncbi:DNA-methyltransferase [Mycoplasma simbae]|uniref:DNA-methyltransferase n=1 Tax=Mycoplasma simbae TaxID=36744 RepID=UPI0004962807|nr:site-specific DNA-methyltransferase [Mycoplasma simbae]
MIKKIELYNDDALNIIEKFLNSNCKVDHIITDPPYNISKTNNFHTLNNPRKGIDFGVWDNGDFNLYSWIPPYSKILRSGGSMIIFCSYRYISHIIEILENKCEGIFVKDVIIWQKNNPMPRNTNRRYVQDMEFAIWAVKGKSKWIFNKPQNQPYVRSLFRYPIVSGLEKTGHPTQKSLKLMEDLISIHTNERDTILDPFMGSGTTGVASLKMKRNFIGIEINSDYFKIAKNRISREHNES